MYLFLGLLKLGFGNALTSALSYKFKIGDIDLNVIIFKYKKSFLAICALIILIAGLYIDAVAGLITKPISYAAPPPFVEQYKELIQYSEPERIIQTVDMSELVRDLSEHKKWIEGFSYEEVLVYKSIMLSESPSELWQLFTHPELEQRIKIASALAAVNIKYTHNEESGFSEKRNKFWLDSIAHMPDIRNALSEALIESARLGEHNRIPYTLAWLPEQGAETVELFLWAARHHPDHNVRRSCMYYVTILSKDKKVVETLLTDAKRDPSYGMRTLALNLRYRQLVGTLPNVH